MALLKTAETDFSEIIFQRHSFLLELSTFLTDDQLMLISTAITGTDVSLAR